MLCTPPQIDDRPTQANMSGKTLKSSGDHISKCVASEAQQTLYGLVSPSLLSTTIETHFSHLLSGKQMKIASNDDGGQSQ